MQQVQNTVLGSIDDNNMVMNQVSNHINQSYDGRFGVVPPEYLNTEEKENKPHLSAPSTSITASKYSEKIIKVLQEYSEQAISSLSAHTIVSITWIIHLQSHYFTQGKMTPLLCSPPNSPT